MILSNLLYTILLFILYAIFDIVVPAIVLHPYVKEHELGFRILFYQISFLAYLSMVSFGLSFCGLYNSFTSWLFFVILPLLFRAFLDRSVLTERIKDTRKNLERESALKEEFRIKYRRRKQIIGNVFRNIWQDYVKPYWLHFIVFLFLVFIIAKDLGYFHLNYYTYACSDEPTHIYWISNLINGNPFPAGLYPHGMHFIIAQFCSMLGINVARAWMSFGIVSITLIMFSAYLVAYRIFKNKFVGLTGIAVLLCSGFYQTYPEWFRRLLMVTPMEFAMYALFVMIYGLISWSKDQKMSSLIMIGLGILGTTLIHVFVTIIAFFVVVAYIIVYHKTMVEKKSLHKLMLCGLIAILLAVLPYIVGILCGYSLEQSFNWGMSNVGSGGASSSGYSYQIEVGYEPIEEPTNLSISDRVGEAKTLSEVYDIASDIFSKYMTSNGVNGFILLGSCLLLFVYGLVLYLKRKNQEENRERSLAFIFISLSWLIIFLVLYIGYFLDIFTLLIPTRSTGFIAMLTILFLGSLLQIVYDIVTAKMKRRSIVDSIIAVISMGLTLTLNFMGFGVSYHDFYYDYTLENIDLKTEEYLVENEEPETWTLISTTNARMGIHPYGYHYEITDLLRCVRDLDELYIPTSDIYVIIENIVPSITTKSVDGSDLYSYTVPASAEYANILLSDVMPIINGEVNSEVYLSTYSRTVIMSHLYYWMEKIKQVYPSEVSVLFEDETCTVYHIRQDEYFLLNLVVDYSDLVQEDVAVLYAPADEQNNE